MNNRAGWNQVINCCLLLDILRANPDPTGFLAIWPQSLECPWSVHYVWFSWVGSFSNSEQSCVLCCFPMVSIIQIMPLDDLETIVNLYLMKLLYVPCVRILCLILFQCFSTTWSEIWKNIAFAFKLLRKMDAILSKRIRLIQHCLYF